ncbi:MAG: transporter substrate-binding domain-containing protein [Actinomycetia bacterium]|nr:transporter substrate-binding domain-containing protein [Actinomycetes bacterium]
MPGGTGLDIELMTELAGALGQPVEFVAYEGVHSDGIFDRLAAGDYDCVAAGTTVTPRHEHKAQFLTPYLISGQALAVDTSRLPHVHSIEDLDGLTIGVQRGLLVEHIAIAVAVADQVLASRLQIAQAALEEAGTLQRIRRKWLGKPYVDQSVAAL